MTGHVDDALRGLLASERTNLLRHCYRMLGTFADAEDVVQDVLLRAWSGRAGYAGDAPLSHWLMRIATNACLNVLAERKRRGLPTVERAPDPPDTPIVERAAAHWVTPAPDAKLFDSPEEAAEMRETVALAFIALLQRLPPRQRAVLLLKDVAGWPAEEIATALELTLGSVNSALHRARATMSEHAAAPADEPPPEALAAYVRAWESRDLAGLVALLADDIAFSMPPHATWFRGARAVETFVQTPRFAGFWRTGLRAVATRANGLPAVLFYVPAESGWRLHSIQLMRFAGARVAEATNFIGAHYLHGFDAPERIG